MSDTLPTQPSNVITNPILQPQLQQIQQTELLNTILEKVNLAQDRSNKTITQYTNDIVFKYFDVNKEYGFLFMIGWFLCGLFIWLPSTIMSTLFKIIVTIFKIVIFLMLFIPIMIIGIVFMILILVMIKVWMLGKRFVEVFIDIINPLLPAPLFAWNIIASIFNAISSFARSFGGRIPRMPTVNNPGAYKINKNVTSIYDIIGLIFKPLKAAAWNKLEKSLN